MCKMISCLVDRNGKVYAVDSIHSHSAIAEKLGVDEDKCLKYEFRLDTRTLFQDFKSIDAPFPAKASHDKAARAFFDSCAGTADLLIDYVKRGNWDEDTLTCLLTAPARKAYSEVEASARKAYDEAVASARKAYSEAVAPARKAYDEAVAPADKLYNEAVVSARKAYKEAVVSAWIALFSKAENRIKVWR